MPGLPFNTGLCQGWVPPGTNYAIPTISYLSTTYSPAGATTLVAIFGSNFKLYSTIKFGTYTPTMIFISSQQIDFYVPSTASGSGSIYPVQVFNDIYGSNVVNYTIDDALGYWYLSPNYSEVITNSNYGGLIVNGPLQINNSTNTSGNTPVTIVSDLVFNSANIANKQSIKWIESGPVCSITAYPDPNNNDTNTVFITGDLNVSGTISPPPSDYRIKDIIEPLQDSPVYSVDNLKPVKYFNKKSKKEEIGFIAHEVQEYFPCLVTGEKDGPNIQTLNYIGLIGILTKEIQILKAEVAELKKGAK